MGQCEGCGRSDACPGHDGGTDMTVRDGTGAQRGIGAKGADAVSPAVALTVEHAAYAALLMVALAVRLIALGRWPLLEAEANTALNAWRSLQGFSWRPGTYVPLLYDAHLVIFGLFQPSDVAVRLVSVIAGSALVLLPYLARDALGRVGAIACACMLSLSPSWVHFSRMADWPILAAFCGALLLVSLWRYGQTRSSRAAKLAAVSLGLGLATGPGIYTTLLGLAVMLATRWWTERVHDRDEPLRTLVRGLLNRRNLWVLLATFLVAATGLVINPDGVGTSVDAAGCWLSTLTPWQCDLDWWAFPSAVITYEFLALTLAAVGAVWGAIRRNAVDIGLSIWMLVVLLMGTVLGHRSPVWVLDLMLPVMVLAGRGFDRLWNLVRGGLTLRDGAAVYVGMLLIGFGLLAVAEYSHLGSQAWWGYFLVTAGVVLLAWLAYWMWDGRAAPRVGLLVVGALMVGLTVRGTTALAYETGRDGREPLVSNPTSLDLRDLESWLARIGAHQATDPKVYAVAYEESLDPLVGWYLKDYPATPVPSLSSAASDYPALIGWVSGEDKWPAGYVGTRFRLFEAWDWATAEVSATERLRWFLYRMPVGEGSAQEIELWVRPDAGA